MRQQRERRSEVREGKAGMKGGKEEEPGPIGREHILRSIIYEYVLKMVASFWVTRTHEIFLKSPIYETEKSSWQRMGWIGGNKDQRERAHLEAKSDYEILFIYSAIFMGITGHTLRVGMRNLE